MKRWMILLFAALTLFVVTAVSASAADLPVSEQPISNITLKLADDGRNYTIRWDEVSGSFYTVQMLDAKTNQWVTVRERQTTARVSPDAVDTDLSVRCTDGTDYATNVSWSAVSGATRYEVRNEVSLNTNDWIGMVSVTGTSAALRLPPNSEQRIRVSAIGNVRFRIYALNSAGTSCNAYSEYTAQDVYLTSCDYTFYTPTAPTFLPDASAGIKEAYALMLTQAVNNTRTETGTVNMTAVSENTATASMIGVSESLHTVKTITCTYKNGSGQATVVTKEDDKDDVTSKSFSLLQTILVPSDGATYLYDQHTLSTFQNYVSDVAVTTSGGKTVVTLTLKPETVTTSKDMVYHPSLVGSAVTAEWLQSTIDKSSAISAMTATVGASTIKATINDYYTLDALEISNPYTLTVKSSLGTLNSPVILDYNYLFSRTESEPNLCFSIGHNWGNWETTVEAKTCSDIEKQSRTCSRCGASESRSLESTVPHTLDAWVVVEKETCKTVGLKVQRCSVCNRIIHQETIPAGGHTPSDWIIEQKSTCTESGFQYQKCLICGQRLAEVNTPASGHNFSAWKSYYSSDPNDSGMDLRFCTVCGFCEARESTAEKPVPPDSKDDAQPNPNACKYCGQEHDGPFGWLIKFFHSILAIFKR